MSTSGEKVSSKNLQARKTVLVYLSITVLCILFDKVYALFGHGVSSAFMSFMFLYPLIGGVIPFLMLWLFIPPMKHGAAYRLSYNLYNSGIAVLTIQSMMTGVFEIAGTSSGYINAFILCGCGFILASVIVFLKKGKRSN